MDSITLLLVLLLVAAGRALLRANPEFRGLLDALGGKPAN